MSFERPAPPIEITNEKIIKLKEWLNDKLDVFDDNGEIDIDKVQRNTAFHMGHFFININGLLMQAKMQMANLQNEYAEAYANEIENQKRNKKFDLDSTQFKFYLIGQESIRKIQLSIDKNSAYIDFLKECLNKVNRYANDAKLILQAEELKQRLGI
jgi:hypothetical protein